MDGLDEEARRVLQQAREAAVSARHSYIGTEHLLFGLLADEISTAALLQSLGGDPCVVGSVMSISQWAHRAMAAGLQVLYPHAYANAFG